MFFYEGLTCPVCQKPFLESEDIVACPECGAPHHRACWQQTGHCHFESAHGTAQQWVRPTEKEATPSPKVNRCPNCGTDNLEHAEFCSRCGRNLQAKEWSATEQPPQYGKSAPYSEYTPFRVTFDPLGGVPKDEKFDEEATAEDLAICVGSNTTYYLPRFKKIKDGRLFQWNWTAFLLAPYWLLYRKQYVAGTLVSLFYLAFNVIVDVIFFLSGVGDAAYTPKGFAMAENAGYLPPLFLMSIGVVVVCVLVGLFGNRLYMNSCIKKVREVKEYDPANYRTALRRTGGVSFVWGAVSYFSISFIASFINALLIL